MLLALTHQRHDSIITNIENACMNAETSKKVWTKLGKGLRPLSGKIVRIIKSIHSLVSSGRHFQLCLRATLHKMGFTPSFCNENLWVLKEADGSLVHILVHVDDVLISSKRSLKCLEMLKQVYDIKTNHNFTRWLSIGIMW